MTRAAEAVTPDTPLRLDVAAETAFPGGGMTASGLRREAARGRLDIERIAGKDFTTLAAIGRMRALCRLAHGDRTFGSDELTTGAPAHGASSTEDVRSARDALLTKLSAPSKSSLPTSPRSTRRPDANVISLKSPSRMS